MVNRSTNSKGENPIFEKFATFFLEKIKKHVTSLKQYQHANQNDRYTITNKILTTIKDEIYKEIMEMKNKGCELNIICTSVLQ